MKTEELTEYFTYLDDLRESGVTNMFGASSYLVQDYGLHKREATKILSAWMSTFSDDDPAKRAKQYVANI